MDILIIATGKMGRGALDSLIADYTKRLPWRLTVREIDIRKKLTGSQRTEEESNRVLAEIPTGSYVIALDERGCDMSSVQLSKLIADQRDTGTRTIVFLIGGADGHGDAVRARANKMLCFGKLTWPHMMIRAMLAEQVYRAWSIDAGHPYHREG